MSTPTKAQFGEARKLFKSDNPIEIFLQSKNVSLIGSGDSRKCKCPLHDDKNPSMSVNVSDGTWKCFAGCGEGGVVELAALMEGKSVDDFLCQFVKERDEKTKKPTEPAVPPPDWNACVEAFTDEKIDKLCEWRGYSRKFVEQLVEHKMVGICETRLAFPIYTGTKVTGTHQKTNSGWITRGPCDRPWVIGDHMEHVFLFESQWDAFALMDAVSWFTNTGVRAVSSILITRGASKGKSVQNMIPPKSRVTVWMQNDQPDLKGNIPAEKWLSDVTSVVTAPIYVARPPAEFKDLNDWSRGGAFTAEIVDACEAAEKYVDPNAKPLPVPLDFREMMKFNPDSDKDCLIGRRWLCRGGSCIWVGSSGLGKSVLTLQAAITFALDEHLFGLEPVRPLKSIIISAEDDDGDIAETIQGVASGMGITPPDPRFEVIMENVKMYRITNLHGLEFIGLCEQLVREHQADLLWINPLLSYYSGNPSDPEKVSEFCGALSSMQESTGVCTMLIHHTGKPMNSDTTKNWSIEDHSYLGLGSSVWTNWARAIVILQAMKKPVGIFSLLFPKRGQRTGIVDESFKRVRQIYLEHAEKGLCWMPSDFCPDGDENTGLGRPLKVSWSRFYESWDGRDKTTSEIKGLLSHLFKVSDKTAFRTLMKWSGVCLFKNGNDLWNIKTEEGQNGQNGQKSFV